MILMYICNLFTSLSISSFEEYEYSGSTMDKFCKRFWQISFNDAGPNEKGDRPTYVSDMWNTMRLPLNKTNHVIIPIQSEFSICGIIIIIISKMHFKHFKLVKAFREKVKVFKRKENILFVVNWQCIDKRHWHGKRKYWIFCSEVFEYIM